jgi:hypothetical protein
MAPEAKTIQIQELIVLVRTVQIVIIIVVAVQDHQVAVDPAVADTVVAVVEDHQAVVAEEEDNLFSVI